MKKVFCKICKEKKNIEINKNDFFLRTDSSNKNLINYKNLICLNCGTIYHSPEINKKKLIKHYQTNYRKTDYSMSKPIKLQPTPSNICQPDQDEPDSFDEAEVIEAIMEELQKELE